MKKRKIKVDPAVRAGQEFLDAFEKIPYSTDRIGQSFVMPVSRKTVEAPEQKQETSLDANDDALAKDLSAREKGREFLERFQKLGYNRDRIGQKFIQKASKPQIEFLECPKVAGSHRTSETFPNENKGVNAYLTKSLGDTTNSYRSKENTFNWIWGRFKKLISVKIFFILAFLMSLKIIFASGAVIFNSDLVVDNAIIDTTIKSCALLVFAVIITAIVALLIAVAIGNLWMIYIAIKDKSIAGFIGGILLAIVAINLLYITINICFFPDKIIDTRSNFNLWEIHPEFPYGR